MLNGIVLASLFKLCQCSEIRKTVRTFHQVKLTIQRTHVYFTIPNIIIKIIKIHVYQKPF